MANWLIVENGPRNLDITRNTRSFSYGVEDEDEAVRAIRKSPRYTVGDTIRYQDADGYRRIINPVR